MDAGSAGVGVQGPAYPAPGGCHMSKAQALLHFYCLGNKTSDSNRN